VGGPAAIVLGGADCPAAAVEVDDDWEEVFFALVLGGVKAWRFAGGVVVGGRGVEIERDGAGGGGERGWDCELETVFWGDGEGGVVVL
jgi:hypothetical protein